MNTSRLSEKENGTLISLINTDKRAKSVFICVNQCIKKDKIRLLRQAARRLFQLTITFFISLLALFIMLNTRSSGRGKCRQCGYQNDLHKCKYCGWTACLACWQKIGRLNCPNCKRGNP